MLRQEPSVCFLASIVYRDYKVLVEKPYTKRHFCEWCWLEQLFVFMGEVLNEWINLVSASSYQLIALSLTTTPQRQLTA